MIHLNQQLLHLPAGQSSVAGIRPTDDTIDEADGSITVTILDDDSTNTPPHYTIGVAGTDDYAPTPIEVSVTDDDAPPVIHVRKTPDFYLREGDPASLQFYIFTGDHEGTTYTTTESEFDITFPVVIMDTSNTVTYDDNGTMMTNGTFIETSSIPTTPITLDAGETTIDQSITFEDDDIDEPHGRFTVVVTADDGDANNSEGRYQSITTTTAETFRVLDNDVPPVIQVTRTATTPIDESGDEATRTATFTYSIFEDDDNPTSRSTRDIVIQVGLTQENGIFFTPLDSDEPSVVNNADTPITVTLAGGALTVDNDIIVPTNTTDEIDGSFTVQVLTDTDSHATPYYTVSDDTNSVTVEVTDDDDAPVITAAVVSATGVEEGEATITFSIDTTTGTTTAAGRDIEIQYTLTETAGDFFGIEVDPATPDAPKTKTDTVTLKAGQTSVMGVTPLEDTIDEDNGTINVQLEENADTSGQYTIPANFASIDGVIIMDDEAPPVIHPVIDTYTEGETTIAFEVYTDEFGEVSTTASAKEIKFNVAIAETSTGGADYIDDNMTSPIEDITLPAGMTRTTADVTFMEDMIDEINGSFTLSVVADDEDATRSAGRYTTMSAGDDVVTLDIEDNDAPPLVIIQRKPQDDTDDPLEEGDMATFIVSITEDGTEYPTVGSAHEIKVRVGVEQTGGDFFDSAPNADAPLEVTIPKYDPDTPAQPIDVVLTTDDDTIDDAIDTNLGTITVMILDDNNEEGDPNYTHRAADNSMDVMIADDDAPPVIQVSESLTEVTEGENAVIVYEIYSDPADPRYTTTGSAFDIDINVAVQVDGQLTDSTGGKDTNNDYFDANLTANEVRPITLPAGHDTVTDTIVTVDDDIDETNGQFTVEIQTDTSGNNRYSNSATQNNDDSIIISNQKQVIKVLDDETPTLSIAPSYNVEGNVGDENELTFTVKSDTASTQDLSFNWNFDYSDASATADVNDFPPFSNINTKFATIFGDGTLSQNGTEASFRVEVMGDIEKEDHETFEVVLSNLNNDAQFASGNDTETVTGTILNDDTFPTISFVDGDSITVLEGEYRLGLEVNLDARPAFNSGDNQAQGTIGTVDGTATLAGGDFELSDTIFRIDPGPEFKNTRGVVVIEMKDDDVYEGDETFEVVLSDLKGVSNTDPISISITIIDNDTLPIVSVSEQVIKVDESAGSVDINLSLSHLGTEVATVMYSTSDIAGSKISATGGSGDGSNFDYETQTDQEITFTDTTSGTISIPIVDDLVDENGDEEFIVTLQYPINATFGPSVQEVVVTVVIVDNDGLPILSFATRDINVLESDTEVVLDVELSAPAHPLYPVSFEWKTVDGDGMGITEAVSGYDFMGTTRLQRMSIEGTTAQIRVPLIPNTIKDGNKKFGIKIPSAAAVTNAKIERGYENLTADVIIWDDEQIPTFSLYAVGGHDSGFECGDRFIGNEREAEIARLENNLELGTRGCQPEGSVAQFRVLASEAPSGNTPIKLALSQEGDVIMLSNQASNSLDLGENLVVFPAGQDEMTFVVQTKSNLSSSGMGQWTTPGNDGSITVTLIAPDTNVNEFENYEVNANANSAVIDILDTELPRVTIEAVTLSGIYEGEDAVFKVTAEPLTIRSLEVTVQIEQILAQPAHDFLLRNAGPRTILLTPKYDDTGSNVIEVSGTFREKTVDDKVEEPDSLMWARIVESTRYNAASDEYLSNVLLRVRDDDRAGFDDLPEISIAPVSSVPVVEGAAVEFEMTASPQFTTPTNVYLFLESVGGEFLDIEAYRDAEVETDGSLGRYTLGQIVNYVHQLEIEFPADSSTLRFSVPTINDEIDESDGELVALIFTLGTPPYRINVNQDTVNLPLVGNVPDQSSSIASVTVLDNDAAPVITIASLSGTSIAEGESAEFVITADKVSQSDKIINVSHTDGDGDFISLTTANHAVLPGGALTARYFVHTDDDDVVETGGGTITVALLGDTSRPIGYAINTDQSMNTVSVNVTDNDVVRPAPLPEISVVAVKQYIDEFGPATFEFTSSYKVSTPLTVAISVVEVPAGNFVTGGPYNSVRFEAGSDKATLVVGIADDTSNPLEEPDGTITLTINDGTDYSVAENSNSAVITVLDDDGALIRPVIRVSADEDEVIEGPANSPSMAVFTVTSDKGIDASGLVVSVMVDQGNGDFIDGAIPTAVSIVNASSTKLEIPIESDDVKEDDGAITVTLLEDIPALDTDPITYLVHTDSSRNTAKVNVYDNDPEPPVIGVAVDTGSTQVDEGDDVVFDIIQIQESNGSPIPIDETITVNVGISETEDFLIGSKGTTIVTHKVIIEAGEVKGELLLATHDDIFEEDDSSEVTATILPGDGYRFAPSGSTFDTATVTVEDDGDGDVTPGSIPTLSVEVAPSSVNGVSEAATDGAEFVISVVDGTPPASLTVNVMIDEGQHRFVDTTKSYQITIANTEFPYTHMVDLDDDMIDEFTGEITLSLESDEDPSDPTAPHTYAVAATPNDSASVTVMDDDVPPSITVASTVSAPGGITEEGDNITFRLTATQASTLVVDGAQSPLRVNVAFGGAINDYISGTLPTYYEIPYNMSTHDFVIPTDDDLFDDGESGTITITVVPGDNYTVGASADATAMFPVVDIDRPTLTIAAGPNITEGEVADFEIDLIPAPEEAMMVYVAVTQYGDFIDEMENVKLHAVEIESNGSGRLMVQTIADEQDEFDGRVIATLQNDSMSPARYTVASAGGMMKDFGRELNGSVYVEVADDDAPVTQITIASNQTLPIVEGNSFTFTLSADPTPESYAPIEVELAVEEENSIEFFTEFTSTHKVSDNTFRITDRNNPITITAHTENDGVDEENGRIYVSIVDKADYIGSERDTGNAYPTNTIDVMVQDVNNDIPVVSIEAADDTIKSVDEGAPFAFTVTMTPAPASGTLQHIELEVTEEVEANNFFDEVEFLYQGNYTSGLIEDSNDPNTVTIYVGGSNPVSARVQTNNDDGYQIDSEITVAVKTLTDSDGEVIYRAHHTQNSVTFAVNNDDLPVLSVADFNVLESTEDSEYNLELNLGTASVEDVTIEYVVAEGQGTATIDDDYELVGSEPEKTLSVMIESGEQTAQIPLMIKGDTVDDPVETFVLTLTATNAEFENGTNTTNVTGSIVEMPVVSISTTQTMTSDADYIEYTVSASPVTSDLSVLLDVIDAVENIVNNNNEEITVSLTAEAPSFGDELEFDITRNMAKDSVVAIEIREDSNYIIDENNNKIEVTVVNSETLPVVSIEGVSPVIEGNNAVFNISVTDQRDINDALIARTADLNVNIMVIEGSTNFITGTPEMEVTIAPTENSATIIVGTTLDDEAEVDDDTGFIGTITAVVQAGTGYQAGGAGSGVGEVNILDGADFPVITFNTENNTAREGGVIAFPFVVTGAATDDTYEEIVISFEVNTETSTAVEGATADFTIFQDSPTTLAAGDTTGRITIRTNTDPLYEAGEETFDIVVTATNAVFSESTSSMTLTGTIEDINENPPVISVASVSTPEDIGVRTDGDASDDEVTFAVTLSEPSEVDVTFYVETVDLSATSGVDYTPIENTCYTGVIEPECFAYESRPRGGKFTIPAGQN